MKKDSFIFHREWYDVLNGLNNSIRHEVLDAILSKVFGSGESNLSVEGTMAMRFISLQIDKDFERYKDICERRKSFGRAGGLAKATKSYQKLANGSKSKQKVASVADNDIQDTNVSMSISDNNKEKETKVSKKKKYDYPQEYENDYSLYGRKGSKKNGYERWLSLSAEDKVKMRIHIPYYLQSNDRQYLKDFEGYINQRMFESPVYKGSVLLYDPMKSENLTDYHPLTDGIFQWWDGNEKCLHFNGQIDMLDDGYTADNRPNGAKVKWQMYSWIWNSITKEWLKQ